MSTRTIREILIFIQEYWFLMLLGVTAVAALIAGAFLRRPSAAKGPAKEKGGKEAVHRDSDKAADDGKG